MTARTADAMAADIHLAAALAAESFHQGGSATRRTDPRRPAGGPLTDSVLPGGNARTARAGVGALTATPAAGHRAYTLTTKGWIAAICASAEPFVWPDP